MNNPGDSNFPVSIIKNDYNLSPAGYISFSEETVYRPIPDILSELKMLRKEEAVVDKSLDQIF